MLGRVVVLLHQRIIFTVVLKHLHNIINHILINSYTLDLPLSLLQ